MTLWPMTSFRFIPPPQVDPDPLGPAGVQRPLEGQPGPGTLAGQRAPFPLPVPPNDNGATAAVGRQAPPDQGCRTVRGTGGLGGQESTLTGPTSRRRHPGAACDGGQTAAAGGPLARGAAPPEGAGDGSSIATYDLETASVEPPPVENLGGLRGGN